MLKEFPTMEGGCWKFSSWRLKFPDAPPPPPVHKILSLIPYPLSCFHEELITFWFVFWTLQDSIDKQFVVLSIDYLLCFFSLVFWTHLRNINFISSQIKKFVKYCFGKNEIYIYIYIYIVTEQINIQFNNRKCSIPLVDSIKTFSLWTLLPSTTNTLYSGN